MNNLNRQHMKIIFTFFILLCSLQGKAQLSYEELDAYSAFVSAKQTEANMRSYTSYGKDFTVSFAEKNFLINFHDGLATQAIYMQDSSGRDVLVLFEEIDFAKATSIVRRNTNHKDAGAIRVNFPEGSIQVTEYENGNKKTTTKASAVDFFFAVTPGTSSLWNSEGKELFHKLADLIYAKKSAAGIVQGTFAKAVTSEWNTALSQFTSAGFQQYYSKYPSGIFAQQALVLKEALDKRDNRYLLLNSRMDSIALLYKFRYGIPSDEFRKLNPDADAMMNYKNGKASGFTYYSRKYNGVGKPWPEGTEAVFFSGNRISSYQYVIKRDKKDRKPVDELFEQLKQDYSKVLEPDMLSLDKGKFIITSPDKTRVMQLEVMSIFGSSSLFITFSDGSSVKK